MAFITDGKLHQHMGQLGLVKLGALQEGAFAEDANPGQARKLNRKGANGDEDNAEGELKELRKTVHGDRSGPQRLVFFNR
jgi:hypothetical protein